MKSHLLASFAAAGLGLTFGASAFAADLGRQAPAPFYTKAPMAAPFSWTGFYAGVQAGYGWTGDDVNTVGSTISDKNVPNTAADAATLHFNTDPKGFLGGGTLGYNFQTGRFVWGAETDLSWADIKGTDSQAAAIAVGPNTVTSSALAEQKMDAFGTLRARAGFTPIERLLIYGTGGLAYGHLESDSNVAEVITKPPPVFSNAIGSASSWRAGWTAGAGMEWAFAPHWSAKAEYLYYDLGDLSYDSTMICSGGGQCGARAPATIGVSSTADFKGNIVRAGVNYKFW